MREDDLVLGGQRVELIGRSHELLARELADSLSGLFREAGRSVESRTNGSTAERELFQLLA